jgi:hypothetical protein
MAAALIGLPAPVAADAGGKPVIAPIGSQPAGQSYGRWAAAWWQWVLGVPGDVSPLLDDTGASCAERQIGDVWFLSGTWLGVPVERTCEIPAGKALFFPLINNAWLGFLTDPPEQRTEEFARSMAACTEPADIEVWIDGRKVANPTRFFTGRELSGSPVFNVQMPPENVLALLGYTIEEIPEWVLSPCAEQGYYLFVHKLAPGTHTIEWTATGCTSGSEQVISYTLHVLEE